MIHSVIAAGICLFAQASAQSVEPKSVDLAGFEVIGVSTRTTNKDEMSPAGKIGPLWKSFAQSADRIPDVTDPDTFSIYTGYETDENGAYEVILGKEVRDLKHVADGMRGIRIPSAHYLVFPVANSSPQGIGAAWQGVYDYFAKNRSRQRTYGIDFDRHSRDKVEIYVSVR